jgi:hypothetical protein
LVTAKGGSKMTRTSPDNKITVDGNVFPMGTSQMYIAVNRVAHLIGKGSSMEQLVDQLTGRVRMPVRDRTGLTGTFDYDVIFALDDLHVDVDSPPAVATAIQDELGLKLEKSKIPVKVLIIDHAERPLVPVGERRRNHHVKLEFAGRHQPRELHDCRDASDFDDRQRRQGAGLRARSALQRKVGWPESVGVNHCGLARLGRPYTPSSNQGDPAVPRNLERLGWDTE